MNLEKENREKKDERALNEIRAKIYKCIFIVVNENLLKDKYYILIVELNIKRFLVGIFYENTRRMKKKEAIHNILSYYHVKTIMNE